MRMEDRREICTDCLDERDRQWAVQTIVTGSPIPKGWHLQPSIGGKAWRTIAAPTSWTTVCSCDAA